MRGILLGGERVEMAECSAIFPARCARRKGSCTYVGLTTHETISPTSARCGHVKRSLRSGKPLKGDLLDFAIEVAGGHEEIIEKLKAGQQLGDYEMHLMIDVFLLHTRLGARPSPLRER